MGRGRIFIYLGLIVILGLVAVVVIVTRLGGSLGGGGGEVAVEPTPPPVPEVTVIATTQRIQRGEAITEDVVEAFSFPENLLIEGMITDKTEVIGKRAKFDLDSGITLTRNMLVDTVDQLSSAGSVAALLIPKGMVAVSIPISRLSSVSYGLERGDQVNVIATMPFVDLDAEFQTVLPNNTSAVIAPGPAALLTIEGQEISTDLVTGGEAPFQNLTAQSATGGEIGPQGRVELDTTLNTPFYVVPSEPQRARVVSQNLIQGAIVLQLGTFKLPGEEEALALAAQQAEEQQQAEAAQQQPPQEGQAEVPQGPEPPDIITLVVSPQDAVTLNYLIYSGAKLSLAMRAADDDTRVDVEAVTLQFLLDEYNIPVPAKLPYGMQPRIDDLTAPMLENDIPVPTEQ